MSSPPTPQRKSTFRSRVGGVIRRSSTAFSIPGLPNRSNTPPPSQDSDNASLSGASISGKLDREGSTTSLNKIDTSPPPAPVAVSSAPSPIPESPAREAAALAAEPQAAAAKGPSPLVNEVVADAASEKGPTPPRSISGTPPVPEPAAAAPQPQSAPQTESQSTLTTEPEPAEAAPTVILDSHEATKPDIAPVLTAEPDEMPSSTPSSRPASKASTPPPASVPAAPLTPAAQQQTSTLGYFSDIPRSATPTGLDSDQDTNVWADHRTRRNGTTSSESVSDLGRELVLAERPSKGSMRPRGSSVASSQVVGAQPLPASRTASRKASGVLQAREMELAGTTQTWSSSSEMGFGSRTSLGLHDDPFVDRKPAVVQAQTVPVVSPTDTIHVPEDVDPRSPRDDTMIAPPSAPPAMPLPAMHEVMATGPVRQTSSSYFDRSVSDSGRFYPRPTDETRPLIPRPSTPPIDTSFQLHTASSQIAQSYLTNANPPVQPVPQWAQPARFDVNGSARSYTYGTTTRPHVARGWTEYSLPHGIRYYVNPDSRAITDIDLRNLARLDDVTASIDAAGDVPEACEMWIRGAGGAKKGWRKNKTGSEPVICWVDHRSRRVLNETPSDEYVPSGEEDRLDDEYRYWTFVEMNPAHISRDVVEVARKEAIDALHWSYTDRLLTHPHMAPIPPPFSQDECVELFRLLNDTNQPMTAAYTRMVARILLRAAHWRQVNFRPYKPLPRDLSYQQSPRSTPILRTIFELLIGILCLGIPFLFVDRARYAGQFDVEASRLPESTMPLFVIGACACLVSAIILSASVTLISFPGLDSIARIGGLVAITCAVLSMVTSFVSIFRYKAEMARGTAPAPEGFVMLSRRSFMLSLPLVFLAYSVAGFVTGVVVYSFRNATLNLATAGSPVAAKFDEYTRFMVVGVLGALAGVLIASAMVARNPNVTFGH